MKDVATFTFTTEGETTSMTLESEALLWPDVVEKFFATLSAAYGYPITAEKFLERQEG